METLQKNFTRQDYLNKVCTHREYYGQYVTGQIKNLVNLIADKPQLEKAILQDENLNNIPLAKWDMLVPMVENNRKQWAQNGDYYTLAGGVCLLKEAAKQIIES